MNKKTFILTKSNPSDQDSSIRVRYCDSFFSKGFGLMFKKELEPDEGIILVDTKESRINSGIHMLFMNFDITVLWLDRNMVVVDKALAKKWKPFYLPKKPAQYVVEMHQARISDYSLEEKLQLNK